LEFNFKGEMTVGIIIIIITTTTRESTNHSFEP